MLISEFDVLMSEVTNYIVKTSKKGSVIQITILFFG